MSPQVLYFVLFHFVVQSFGFKDSKVIGSSESILRSYGSYKRFLAVRLFCPPLVCLFLSLSFSVFLSLISLPPCLSVPLSPSVSSRLCLSVSCLHLPATTYLGWATRCPGDVGGP